MSVWHNPQVSICTSTWPGPGSGTGTSRISRGAPSVGTTAAFMILSLHCVADGYGDEQGAGEQEQAGEDEGTATTVFQDGDLGPGGDVGDDALGAVGTHQHEGPAALPGLPLERRVGAGRLAAQNGLVPPGPPAGVAGRSTPDGLAVADLAEVSRPTPSR